jgi:S1-C subfamily serine protease
VRSALAGRQGEGAKHEDEPKPADAGLAHKSAQDAPNDEPPLARPASGRRRLLTCIGGGAALLVVVGIGLAVFWPEPYDLEELDSLLQKARGLVEEALDPDGPPIRSLDKEALLRAHDRLAEAVALYRELSRRLATLKGYETDDELRELREAVGSRFSIAKSRLDDVRRRLWPGPGSVADMFARVSPSVPIIVVRKHGRTGSGFLVEHKRRPYVVTNRHVVERGNHGFTIRFLTKHRGRDGDSPEFDVEPNTVALVHLHQDLAAIQLEEDMLRLQDQWGIRPLVLAEAKGDEPVVQVDDPIWVVGHPGAGPYGLLNTLDKGEVSAVTEPSPGDPTLIRFSAPINKGNSGGPVLNSDGRVVGVAFATLPGKQQMNLAVHVHKLHELFAEQERPESFGKEDILRIVDPESKLGEDHEMEARRLRAEGYKQCEWSGLNRTRYLELAPNGIRHFNATKGRAYRVLLTSAGFHGEVNIRVAAQDRLVYAKITNIGEVAVGEEGLSRRSGFTATFSGRHEVLLSGRPSRPGEVIPVCASVFEMELLPPGKESDSDP